MADEYVKRKDVMKILMDVFANPLVKDKIGEATECVCLLPSADVQPVVHGEWVNIYPLGEDYDHVSFYTGTCSACGKSSYFFAPLGKNFCPNCGARMDGGT